MPDEKQVVIKAAAGDPDAFEQLVITHQKRIYNLALKMTGNPEDASDMTQEAFLKAYRGLGGFNMESSFSTWLYRLASNVCIDFIRKRNKRSVVSLNSGGDEERELEITDTRYEPSGLAERRQERADIQSAIDSLDSEHRQVLMLREIMGLSYQEISDITKVKQGTVKSRIARARERLRKTLISTGNYSDEISSQSM